MNVDDDDGLVKEIQRIAKNDPHDVLNMKVMMTIVDGRIVLKKKSLDIAHSYFSAFAGLELAAFMEWKLTVNKAITVVIIPEKIKISHVMPIR